MENVIVVDEKYSKYWVWALALGISLSLMLYTFSNTTTSVVLGNYLQLAAFICVAITIFSVIKLWEGKKNIKLSLHNQSLIVDIYQQEDALQRDRYELKQVDHVALVPSQISIPFLNIYIDRQNASTFQLQLNNEERPLFLFADRLTSFLEEQQIKVTVSK